MKVKIISIILGCIVGFLICSMIFSDIIIMKGILISMHMLIFLAVLFDVI